MGWMWNGGGDDDDDDDDDDEIRVNVRDLGVNYYS